jgi:hypothetical protein
MGILVSRLYEKLPTEWTVYDEARALIAASKTRYKELCAEDNVLTDAAADTIAHLMIKTLSNFTGRERVFIVRPDDIDELVWRAALESRLHRILETVHMTFPKYDINFTNTDKDTVYLGVIDTERVRKVVDHIRKDILKNARLGKWSLVVTCPDHISIEDWKTCLKREINAIEKEFPKFVINTNDSFFSRNVEPCIFVN